MGTPIESGEVQGDGESGNAETPGLNPAWGEALSAIPEQFHQVLTPHFEKWDQSAQQRIEQANQTVSQFEPYKPFVENGISAQDLEQGIQLMYQLNTNPQAVYNALAEAYGFNAATGEIEGEEEEGEEDPNFQDPRFDSLQQGLDLVAQTLLQQEQQKLESQAEAQIDTELNQLREKHPNISEEFALSLMVNGFGIDDIGKQWDAISQNILQQNPRPFAPQVLGNSSGGTGLPSQAIDPKTLSGKDTRNLVVQMLNAANRDG